MVEAVQSLKQLLEQDFNKKIESMKADFQLEYTKLRDRMAEEVTRATAQMAQDLLQVRDQLTQVCGELEQARLQLDTLRLLGCIDFSKVQESVAKAYPDWLYISPNGTWQNHTNGLVSGCPSGKWYQEQLFDDSVYSQEKHRGPGKHGYCQQFYP